MQDKIEEFKELLDKANFVTFLTGAGVSVPSGIPIIVQKTDCISGRVIIFHQNIC